MNNFNMKASADCSEGSYRTTSMIHAAYKKTYIYIILPYKKDFYFGRQALEMLYL